MHIYDTSQVPYSEILAVVTSKVETADSGIERVCRDIIAHVRVRGDEALLELGRKFDSPDLAGIRVEEDEFEQAFALVDENLLDAIRTARDNIRAFHERQVTNSWFEARDGFIYGQMVRPIQRVGFYAPGGLAPYPSTVLMTAVPGLVAGVEELVMFAPAQRDGKIHPAMLAAARECGVSEVYKAGGAQAVAAMTYGTETIRRVDKIVGPGNAYVTEAKRQVFGLVGVDKLAGPSEILIVADDTANATYAAADLLSQAEHADDSRCAMFTTSRSLAENTAAEVHRMLKTAARAELARKSIGDFGIMVVTRSLSEAIDLANAFAPEHLELCVEDPWNAVQGIKHAGTIMLGHYTPVPLCDFAAGPNHTLPTSGTARFSSALSVDDYVKKSGLLSYSREALEKISGTVITMAEAEGFQAHADTLRVRLDP
jgi:histidinol dehydrogenase